MMTRDGSSFRSKFPPLFARSSGLLPPEFPCHLLPLPTPLPPPRDLSLAAGRRSLSLPARVRASRNGGREHAQPGARPRQLRVRLRRRPPSLPQLHCPRRRRPRSHPTISSAHLISPFVLTVVSWSIRPGSFLFFLFFLTNTIYPTMSLFGAAMPFFSLLIK